MKLHIIIPAITLAILFSIGGILLADQINTNPGPWPSVPHEPLTIQTHTPELLQQATPIGPGTISTLS